MTTLIIVVAYLALGVGIVLIGPSHLETGDYYPSEEDDLVNVAIVVAWPLFLIIVIMGMLGGLLSRLRHASHKWFRERNRK